MKTLKITLILLFISLSSLAQSGMVFQGIARDNTSAAITDKTMMFTFRITLTDGTDLYKETQQIKTDNYGVFSHVIGTGSAVTGTFAGVDFGKGNLKSIIEVENGGTTTEIYNQKFEYVPYAKRAESAKKADNGVPVGTIVALLAGGTLPEGWIDCNGQSLADNKFATLRDALGGMINVPNLGGVYLKGSGAPNNSNFSHEIALGAFQDPATQTHTHVFEVNGNTQNGGQHSHNIRHQEYGTPDGIDHGGADQEWGFQNSNDVNNTSRRAKKTDDAGNHNHNIAITGQRTGHGGILGNTQRDGNLEKENRPFSYGVRWIIKY